MFAIREGFEIGLVYMSVVPVSIWFFIFWGLAAISFFAKMLFFKKCRSKVTKNLGYFIFIPLLLLLDIMTDLFTGWERLVPLFAYFLVLSLLIGHILYDISVCFRRKIRQKRVKGDDSV